MSLRALSTVLTALLVGGFAALVALGPAGPAGAQDGMIRTPKQMPLPRNPNCARLEIETLHVQGNVYLLAGAGANVAVQIGEDGVLVVDTGYAEMSDKLLAAIRELTDKPIRVVVSTTLAKDHTGGTVAVVGAGLMNQAGPGLGGRTNRADSVAHAELLRLMSDAGEEAYPGDMWPETTYSVADMDLYSTGEPVVLLHETATTAGDSIVWFRRSDVVVAGELFNQTSFPRIDVANGGTINGVIEGLNDLLDITVPAHLQEGGTYVIPSHGRISDEHDVLEYRDMITIIRDRVQHAIDEGMSLRQVQAMEPRVTYEYEPRFDRDPQWTAEMFVAAVYTSLQGGVR
jgi:glyoxylase-like metal-dependent hydrolase (beta-lactamase superfamily II)